MDLQSPDQFDQVDQPRSGMSTGAKVGIGCAATLVILIILICGGGWWWWSATWGPYQEFGDEFEQQGYTRMEGTGIDIERNLTGPHVIVGFGVNIEGDVDGDLAIASYAGNIEGTIDGDLDFYGLVLNIGPNAHITGNIRVRSATAVHIEGRVDGEVTGEWSALDDRRRELPQEQGEDQDQNEDP